METKFSVRDSILAELRKSGNASEVRKSCRSMSLFSECLNEYIDERLRELEELDSDRGKLEASVTSLQCTNNGLKEDNSLLSADNQRLVSDNDRLSEEVQQKSENIEALDSRLDYLVGKGISQDMLEKASRIEERSGHNLLDHLESLEDRNNLAEACAVLEKHKGNLEKKIKRLEKKSERADAQRVSKEDQLETINDAIVEAEAKFDIIENKVITSINEIKYSGMAVIKDVAEKERQNGNSVCVNAVKNVEEVSRQAIEKIYGIGVVAEDGICRVTKRTGDTLEYVENSLLGLVDSFRDGLGEWSELQKMKGELGKDILYGKAFLNITGDFEILRKIPPLVVTNMLDRCVLWNRMNFPGSTFKATEIITQRDWGLIPSWP